MTLSDDNLTRVAQHLDGQPVSLSAADEALAAQVRTDEQALAPMLDVGGEAMARALAKAQRQMSAELARPPHSMLRISIWGGAVAAAAAILLVVVLQMQPGHTPGTQVAGTNPPASTAANSSSYEFPDFPAAVETSNADADLELLTVLGSENELRDALDVQVVELALLES